MKLIQLLKTDFFNTKQVIKELSHFESVITEDFGYKNEYKASDTVSNYKKIIRLQKQSADRNRHPTLGFESLMDNLSTLDDTATIFMKMLESESWGGRLYFHRNQQLLGVFLGKKRRKKWQTPPDWDGSQKELEEYNEHLGDS